LPVEHRVQAELWDRSLPVVGSASSNFASRGSLSRELRTQWDIGCPEHIVSRRAYISGRLADIDIPAYDNHDDFRFHINAIPQRMPLIAEERPYHFQARIVIPGFAYQSFFPDAKMKKWSRVGSVSFVLLPQQVFDTLIPIALDWYAVLRKSENSRKERYSIASCVREYDSSCPDLEDLPAYTEPMLTADICCAPESNF
jgi:hypothetical protein